VLFDALTMLADCGDERSRRYTAFACNVAQKPRITLPSGQLGSNASLLEQQRRGSERKDGLAMPILILQKFKRMAIRDQYIDSGRAVWQDLAMCSTRLADVGSGRCEGNDGFVEGNGSAP
jgi:hypothetical protein